jgi:hypothetical protein
MKFKRVSSKIMNFMVLVDVFLLTENIILVGSKMGILTVMESICSQMEATKKVRDAVDNTLIEMKKINTLAMRQKTREV